MKIANAKGLVTKGMMVVLAAGTVMFAGAAKAQAQQFAVGVQLGQPAYGVPAYAYDRDGYRNRDDYRYGRDDYRYNRDDRWQEEAREREQREEFARRQAYIRQEQHERWEHQQYFDGRYDRR